MLCNKFSNNAVLNKSTKKTFVLSKKIFYPLHAVTNFITQKFIKHTEIYNTILKLTLNWNSRQFIFSFNIFLTQSYVVLDTLKFFVKILITIM